MMAARGSLFDLRPEFQIATIGPEDARSRTDHLATLKKLVLSNEPMYPGIASWWEGKIVPGLRSGERKAWVGYEGEKAIASAIVKEGQSSKFCHLRIHQDFQDLSLGEVFFSLMALNVRHVANEVHFTLPESLWTDRAEFFRSFGFETAEKSPVQYRASETELLCSAPLEKVWRRVLGKLPALRHKFSVGGFGSNLLMSVKPEFAEKILSGEKTVEIRRGPVAAKWTGQRVAIYASRPDCALLGEATIESVRREAPGAVWELHGSELGCSREQFDGYTEEKAQVSVIRLGDVRAYRSPVPISQISQLIGEELRAPESTCSLSRNRAWAQAVSVANLLHGNFAKSRRLALI